MTDELIDMLDLEQLDGLVIQALWSRQCSQREAAKSWKISCKESKMLGLTMF